MKRLKDQFKHTFCKHILNYAVDNKLTAKTLALEAKISEEEASKILTYDYGSLTVDFIVFQYDKLIYSKRTSSYKSS